MAWSFTILTVVTCFFLQAVFLSQWDDSVYDMQSDLSLTCGITALNNMLYPGLQV